MNGVSDWILSITGIILVSLIVEIILPNGKTNNLIKSIVSIFSVFIIISPLKDFNINNFDISSAFNSQIVIDSTFINNRNEEKIKAYEKLLIDALTENGYLNVKITIKGYFDKEKLLIDNIFVDLCDLVLLENKMNINKYTNIIAIIKKLMSIEEDKIVFYE